MSQLNDPPICMERIISFRKRKLVYISYAYCEDYNKLHILSDTLFNKAQALQIKYQGNNCVFYAKYTIYQGDYQP